MREGKGERGRKGGREEENKKNVKIIFISSHGPPDTLTIFALAQIRERERERERKEKAMTRLQRKRE